LDNAREKSGAFVIGYVPTVKSNEFDLWTSYVIENQDWVNESLQVYQEQQQEQQMVESFTRDVLIGEDKLFVEQIWQVEYRDEDGNPVVVDTSKCNGTNSDNTSNLRTKHILTEPSNEPASPLWTVSPPPNPNESRRSQINFNMRSDNTFQDAVSIIEQYRTSTFHDICTATAVSTLMNFVPCSA
jgi:hypothetical protein